MTTPDAALFSVAVVSASVFCFSEAATVGQRLPAGGAWKLGLRRAPLRVIALSLLLIGLRHWAEVHAALVWQDLELFVLRSPAGAPLAAGSWALDAALVLVGMALLWWTFPPVVSAAVGGLLAFATPVAWVVVVWLFPLQHGHRGALLGLALLLALPGWAMAQQGWSRARRSGVSAAQALCLVRLMVCLRRLALGWLFLSVVLLSDRWPSDWVTLAIVWLVAGASMVTLWRVADRGLREDLPDQARRFRHSLGVVSEAWMLQRPVAWLLACALACTGHWAVVVTAAPAAARTGRAVLDQVTSWPQLLTGEPDPSDRLWVQVAARTRQVLSDYRGHPWCGRWMLLLAWIESSRLHHFHTAAMLLREARREYGRAAATAPPGWPRGRTVGEIVERTLAEWGRLVEPGGDPC